MILKTSYKMSPPVSVRLRTGHAIAKDLACCWLANEGSGIKLFDAGPAAIDLAIANSPAWSTGRFGRAILYDDASSQYAQADKSAVGLNPTALSLLTWFNSDDAAADQTLIQVTQAVTANSYHTLYLVGSLAGDYLRAGTNGVPTFTYAATTKGFTVGRWHQAAGVFRGNNYRAAYIDGANKGTDTTASTNGNLDRTAIGAMRDSTPGYYMSGRIAVAMIWKRALSDSEIAYLYRRPFCMFEASR